MFEFKPYSKGSIVKEMSLTYQTPNNSLQTMISIQNKSTNIPLFPTTQMENENQAMRIIYNLIGSKQRFNKHSIVVNNNIKTQFKGQYEYSDGTPVPANELIHIHADGVTMTGGVHTKDSVQIYPPKDRRPITKQQISQIKQATTLKPSASIGKTPLSSSSGSSGGGGY